MLFFEIKMNQQYVINDKYQCVPLNVYDQTGLRSFVYATIDACQNDASLLASLGTDPVVNRINYGGIGDADFSNDDYGYGNQNFWSYGGGLNAPYAGRGY